MGLGERVGDISGKMRDEDTQEILEKFILSL